MLNKQPTMNRNSLSRSLTPVLPPEELSSFVSSCFGQRDRYLQILAENRPPLYLLESFTLKQKAAQFLEAFQSVLPHVSAYYAVKSNNHPDVSKTLLQAGFGLDVSSGLELEMALKLGARDVVFSGPGKTEEELRLALNHSDRLVILVDSFGELERLKQLAGLQKRKVRIGVRLTTDTRGLWRKFGIATELLASFWEKSRCCEYIIFCGLQFHLSWNRSPDAQIEFICRLAKELRRLPTALREAIGFLDIGGGYWPSQGEWLQAGGTPEGILQKALGRQVDPLKGHYRLTAVTIETFADRLGSAIREHLFPLVACRICLEPGRWICNDALQLFITVVDKKGPNLVVTDAGTNAVGWERFETDYFPVLNLSRPALEEKPCHILGSLCTPHDVWGYSYWGEDIQPGDVLMVPSQGAYTYSLRQHFIKPLPRLVTV